ncbi:hypothetical protein PUN28_010969 [Cardiocondyla obscurior]|uniref:Uncharacterized protein n=1 Tax=Cardiocondyla obscurior TaxID=286306 RepID=A0AAW2FNT3_9HYME
MKQFILCRNVKGDSLTYTHTHVAISRRNINHGGQLICQGGIFSYTELGYKFNRRYSYRYSPLTIIFSTLTFAYENRRKSNQAQFIGIIIKIRRIKYCNEIGARVRSRSCLVVCKTGGYGPRGLSRSRCGVNPCEKLVDFNSNSKSIPGRIAKSIPRELITTWIRPSLKSRDAYHEKKKKKKKSNKSSDGSNQFSLSYLITCCSKAPFVFDNVLYISDRTKLEDKDTQGTSRIRVGGLSFI